MNQLSQTDAIPSLAVRRLRGSIRTELEIAGASKEALQNVDKALDEMAVEMLVISAAEVLSEQNQVLEYAVRRACERMNMDTYVAPEELIDRICYDTTTREAVAEGYARLRGIVRQSKTTPQTATPMHAVPVSAPPVALPPPRPGRPSYLHGSYLPDRRLRTIVLTLAAVVLFLGLLLMAYRSLSAAATSFQSSHVPESTSPTIAPQPTLPGLAHPRKSR